MQNNHSKTERQAAVAVQRMVRPPDWNDLLSDVNFILGRVNAHQNSSSMFGPVNMSILDTCTFKPQLQSLVLASDFGIEWVADKIQAVGAIEVRFGNQLNWITIEFYTDSFCRLAVVFNHKNDGSSVGHVFFDFVPHDAKYIAIGRIPARHLSPLASIFIKLTKSLQGWNQIGSGGTPSNLSKLQPIPCSRAMPPETKCETSKSKKPTAQYYESLHDDVPWPNMRIGRKFVG